MNSRKAGALGPALHCARHLDLSLARTMTGILHCWRGSLATSFNGPGIRRGSSLILAKGQPEDECPCHASEVGTPKSLTRASGLHAFRTGLRPTVRRLTCTDSGAPDRLGGFGHRRNRAPPHAIEVWRTLTRSDMGALINCGHSRPSIETGP